MSKIPLLIFSVIFAFALQQSREISVYSIGDSTMCDLPTADNYPGRGWMQMMGQYFAPGMAIFNCAKSGRSSKSFRDEGFWQPVYNKLQPGDYVFIQFGHNDEKTDSARHTDACTTFRANMSRYATEVREKGAHPIFFTSIVRRSFDSTGHLKDTHGDYVKVVRELSTALNVPLVDLNANTGALVEGMGPEDSKKLFMYIEPGVTPSLPQGRKDDTHLCIYGATQVAKLAAREIRSLNLPISKSILLTK